MSELRVIINDESFISEEKLIKALAGLYTRKDQYRLPVAILCDDYLDPSGRLLGKVRDESVTQTSWAAYMEKR